MRKLKHYVSTIGTNGRYFKILQNDMEMSGEWNRFESFLSAEEYLIENFHPSKGTVYAVQEIVIRVKFWYK